MTKLCFEFYTCSLPGDFGFDPLGLGKLIFQCYFSRFVSDIFTETRF